jgi:hypothetical protein
VNIIFFTTSCPSTLKVRGDIERITQILNAKRIPYEEVRHTESNISLTTSHLTCRCRVFLRMSSVMYTCFAAANSHTGHDARAD